MRHPRIIAWITDLGPLGGASGLEEEAYAALLADCIQGPDIHELLEPKRTLYFGAAAACRAAFFGDTSLWPTAERAVDVLAGRTEAFNCLDNAAYLMLRTLLQAHRTDPGVTLLRGQGSKSVGPHCPRLRSLSPEKGPREGGYRVVITGENLPPRATIHFGRLVMNVSTEDDRAVLTAPPADEAAEELDRDGRPVAMVWVEGWPFEGTNTPYFTYEVPTSTRSGPDTDESSPPTSPA